MINYIREGFVCLIDGSFEVRVVSVDLILDSSRTSTMKYTPDVVCEVSRENSAGTHQVSALTRWLLSLSCKPV